MTSTTDIHTPSNERYGNYGELRNMTIIYAKDKSLESLREAIEAHRTLAFSYGTLAGDEELLRKFFEASVSARKVHQYSGGRVEVLFTNTSSVDWLLACEGEKMMELKGNSSILVRIDPSKSKSQFTVLNTWYGENKHLVYDFKLW